MQERVTDQSLIEENDLAPSERIQATRGYDYAFIYTSEGKSFHVYLDKISGSSLHAYWYNPRDGKTTDIDYIQNSGITEFSPPSRGYGQDWVLVLDDAAKYKHVL